MLVAQNFSRRKKIISKNKSIFFAMLVLNFFYQI